MKTTIKLVACLLLAFNGVGALFGGWNLIQHPDGSSLQMSQGYLQYSPFENYFIPGVILFVANGLFSFIVVITVILNLWNYALLVMAQGSILLGWILIQIAMVKMLFWLHFVMGGTGILLILVGYLLMKMERQKRIP